MGIIKKFIINILSHAVLIYVLTTMTFLSITVIGGIPTYLIIGIVLGILSGVAKPIMKLLILPISLLFGGLVSLAINIVFLFLLQYIINNLIAIENFQILFGGVLDYVIAGILFTLLSGAIHWLLD